MVDGLIRTLRLTARMLVRHQILLSAGLSVAVSCQSLLLHFCILQFSSVGKLSNCDHCYCLSRLASKRPAVQPNEHSPSVRKDDAARGKAYTNDRERPG